MSLGQRFVTQLDSLARDEMEAVDDVFEDLVQRVPCCLSNTNECRTADTNQYEAPHSHTVGHHAV